MIIYDKLIHQHGKNCAGGVGFGELDLEKITASSIPQILPNQLDQTLLQALQDERGESRDQSLANPAWT